MAVNVKDVDGVLEVRVSGKLTGEDYHHFVHEIERRIEQRGKLRVLFIMDDFHGWNPAGLWEDIKFDAKHFNDIERIAMVGQAKWQEWMSAFCRPFTTADIRYFEHEQLDEARRWLGAE